MVLRFDRSIDRAREAARREGFPEAQVRTLALSSRAGKRFMIKSPDGKWVHFGLWPYRGHGAYIDHGNERLREAWHARHSKIMRRGAPAYMDPSSPEFYSWWILW